MVTYTIAEFTEDVMRQLKGFVQEGESVEFEIQAYNTDPYFLDDELNKRGICVVCGASDIKDNCAVLKYTVVMK